MWPKLTGTHAVTKIGGLQEIGRPTTPVCLFALKLKVPFLGDPLPSLVEQVVGHTSRKARLSQQFPHVIWGKKKERYLKCFSHVIRKQPISNKVRENWCVDLGALRNSPALTLTWEAVLCPGENTGPAARWLFDFGQNISWLSVFSSVKRGGNDTSSCILVVKTDVNIFKVQLLWSCYERLLNSEKVKKWLQVKKSGSPSGKVEKVKLESKNLSVFI